MLKSAAIFDLDGTLITFNFNARGTKRALLEEFRELKIDTEGLDETSPTQKILDTAKERTARVSGHDYRVVRRRLFDVIDRFEVETIRATSMFPGTRGTLRLLKSEGVVLGLLTNSGRLATDYILKKQKIADMFSLILTRDDVESMKPSPQGLLMAIGMLPRSVRDVYYVGDSPYDIAAAKQAGVRVISVPTGNYTEQVLREEGADYVVRSIELVPKVLGIGK